MNEVLVIQGAGMDLRGKTQVEIFGPETLDEINQQIESHAAALGLEVDIFQSNDEASVVARLGQAAAQGFAAMVINPGGFTTTEGELPAAIERLPFPAIEVHASNPSTRGVRSTVQPVCAGAVCGFGYFGYRLALEAVVAQQAKTD